MYRNADFSIECLNQDTTSYDAIGGSSNLWCRVQRDSGASRRSSSLELVGGDALTAGGSQATILPGYVMTNKELERPMGGQFWQEVAEGKRAQTAVVGQGNMQTFDWSPAANVDYAFAAMPVPTARNHETAFTKPQNPSQIQPSNFGGSPLLDRTIDSVVRCAEHLPMPRKSIPPHRKSTYRNPVVNNLQMATRGQGILLDPRKPPFVPGHLGTVSHRHKFYDHQKSALSYEQQRRHSHPVLDQASVSSVSPQMSAGSREDCGHWEMYRMRLRSAGSVVEDSTRPLAKNPLHLGPNNVVYRPFSSQHPISLCTTPTPHTPHGSEHPHKQHAIVGSARAAVQIPASDPRPASASMSPPAARDGDYFGNASLLHGNHTLNQIKIVLGSFASSVDSNTKSTNELLWGLIDGEKIDFGGSLQTRLHRLTCTITDTDRLMADAWRMEIWGVLTWIAGGGLAPVPILQLKRRAGYDQAMSLQREIGQVPGNIRVCLLRRTSSSSDDTVIPEQEPGDGSGSADIFDSDTSSSFTGPERSGGIHGSQATPWSDVFEVDLVVQNFFLSPEMDAYLDYSHKNALDLQIAISLVWRKIHKVFTREWRYGISKHARRGVIIRALRNVYDMLEMGFLRDEDTDVPHGQDVSMLTEEVKPMSRVWNRRCLCLECEPEAMAQDGYFLELVDKCILEEICNMGKVEQGIMHENKTSREPPLPKCPDNSIAKLIRERGAINRMGLMESYNSPLNCCADASHSADTAVPLSRSLSEASSRSSSLLRDLMKKSQISPWSIGEELLVRLKLQLGLSPRIVENKVLGPIFDRLDGPKRERTEGENDTVSCNFQDGRCETADDRAYKTQSEDGRLQGKKAKLNFLEMLHLDRMVFISYVVREVLKIWHEERGCMGRVWWKFPEVTSERMGECLELEKDMEVKAQGRLKETSEGVSISERTAPQMAVETAPITRRPPANDSALAKAMVVAPLMPMPSPGPPTPSSSPECATLQATPPSWSQIVSGSCDVSSLEKAKSPILNPQHFSVHGKNTSTPGKKIPPHRKPSYVSPTDVVRQESCKPGRVKTASSPPESKGSDLLLSSASSIISESALAEKPVPPHKKVQYGVSSKTYASVASSAVAAGVSNAFAVAPLKVNTEETPSIPLIKEPPHISQLPVSLLGDGSVQSPAGYGVLASQPIHNPVPGTPESAVVLPTVPGNLVMPTSWNPPTRPRFMSYSEAASSAIRAAPIRPVAILKKGNPTPSKEPEKLTVHNSSPILISSPVEASKMSAFELSPLLLLKNPERNGGNRLIPLATSSLEKMEAKDTQLIKDPSKDIKPSGDNEMTTTLSNDLYKPKQNTWLAVSSGSFRIQEDPVISQGRIVDKERNTLVTTEHVKVKDEQKLCHEFQADERVHAEQTKGELESDNKQREKDLKRGKEQIRVWIKELEEWLWIRGEGIGVEFVEEGEDGDDGNKGKGKERALEDG